MGRRDVELRDRMVILVLLLLLVMMMTQVILKTEDYCVLSMLLESGGNILVLLRIPSELLLLLLIFREGKERTKKKGPASDPFRSGLCHFFPSNAQTDEEQTRKQRETERRFHREIILAGEESEEKVFPEKRREEVDRWDDGGSHTSAACL